MNAGLGLVDPAHRVVLFGDLLLSLSPPAFDRIAQASSFQARYTGAEANAGVSLVNFGLNASMASRVPDNELGDACLAYLRRFGIEVGAIARGGDRLGVVYVEAGAAQRPSSVLYDRAGSAFATSAPSDYDWATILDGAAWLHFSGTAPALGAGVVAALLDGLRYAKAHEIRVSCDLNFRSKLWSQDEAQRIMADLMPYVDVLIGNEEDAEKVFGIRASGSDVGAAKLAPEGYGRVAHELAERFGIGSVAITLRQSLSASHNRWAGLLHVSGQSYLSRTYDILPIVDRVGAGDAFSGALIYGVIAGFEPQRCIDFAVAASCLKHSIAGDFNLVSVEEVERLVAGDQAGRVRR